jgi:DHA1 family multidrug resistance protein-like MFS transporter
MKETLRDTVFGQLLRAVFGHEILPYPEELDPSIWQKYVHVDKSGWMARHGTTEPHNYLIDKLKADDESKGPRLQANKVNDLEAPTSQSLSRASSTSENSETRLVNEISGIVVDPAKGKDVYVVDWSGTDDPQVRDLRFVVASLLLTVA